MGRAGPFAAAAILSLAIVAGVAGLTVRTTVLRTGFFGAVVDRTNSVERIYDEVLVDPALLRLRRDLTVGQLRALRTVSAGVGVNVRLVLPPATVRALIDDQVTAVVGWLRGDTSSVHFEIPLDPIIANLHGLADAYLSEVLTATPTLSTETLPALRAQMIDVVADIRSGRRPDGLPSLTAFRDDPVAATTALLAAVPSQLRDPLRPLVETTMRADDAQDALALVLDIALARRAASAGADLVRLADGRRISLTSYVAAAVPPSTADTVRRVRWWLGTPLLVVIVASLVVAALALTVLMLIGASPRRVRRGATALLCSALLSGALGLAVWLWLGSMIDELRRRQTWPASVRGLLVDNLDAARSEFVATWLRYAAAVLVAGTALAVAEVVVRHRRRRRAQVGRAGSSSRGYLTIGAAAVGSLTLAALLLPGLQRAERRCNGAAYLCDRPYNQVVALTTHNAMASTQDRFLFPLQDIDIDSQLDAGARALQLDSWAWETPAQVGERLAESDFPPSAVDAARRFLAVANPVRAGTWLCHSVCRLGALPIVASFVALRQWLDRNPREVVTVILQDETPAARTVAAVRAARLVPYLAVPPADPNGDWPTLGQMITSGRRLVLFTENATDAAPWLQNFYRYGQETPFSFSSAAEMAEPAGCVAHRGGSEGALFLLNNFVTPASGSRGQSALANAATYLRSRIAECEAQRHRIPTLIAVDFATLGQAQRVVDDLNRQTGNLP